MKKPRITVIGSNMVDLISYIERMPKTGETITAPDFSLGYGGKGANQAVAAALLGGDVRMVTKVGDDLFGPNTIKNLEFFGINTDFSEIEPGVSSGVAPIFVDNDSNNSILIIKGANSKLEPVDIDRAADLIIDSDIVIMQLEINLETVYYTVDFCKKHNVPVILNPAPADPHLDADRVKSAAFFIPNETELQTLTKMEIENIDQVKEAAGSLQKDGFENIIVTLGEKGALFLSKTGTELIPAVNVKSIDTTGAGDAFIGCFAVYFCETKDVIGSIKIANRYAALSTTKQGTQKSLISRAEFESPEN